MMAAPMPIPTEPEVDSDPVTEALGNIISVAFYPLAFCGFLLVAAAVLWIWVAVLEKIAAHRNPKSRKLSSYEIKRKFDARKGPVAERTTQILGNADAYEYTRLFAMEAQGIPGVTERLDELESIATAQVRAREDSS